jgi:hypothetical protein
MSERHRTTSVPGLSFSWRRAIGLTRLENKISRETGIPLSRSGRQRKVGELAMHFIGWVVMVGVPVTAAYLLFKGYI